MGIYIGVVGIQHGDEGKAAEVGDLTVYALERLDGELWTGRFNGGPNAGHTLWLPDYGEIKFHLTPAGIAFKGVSRAAVLSGVYVNPELFINEVTGIKKKFGDIYPMAACLLAGTRPQSSLFTLTRSAA